MGSTAHRIQFNSVPPQKKESTLQKLVQVLYLLSETLKIVCKGHIYAFLLKTEVLLAQLVEHYTFNVGVTSSSLVGDTFLIVMGLFLVLISYELV